MLREVAKCLECLTDRQAFESILLDWRQVLPVGEPKFDARQIALQIQFLREFIALLAGNRLALLPRFVRAKPLVGRNVSALRAFKNVRGRAYPALTDRAISLRRYAAKSRRSRLSRRTSRPTSRH